MNRPRRYTKKLAKKLSGLSSVFSKTGYESGLRNSLTRLGKNSLRILPRETSRLPFVLSLLVTGVWVFAAAPEITWFDTGELAGAGFGLGVSHPPGQPLHALGVKLFSFIPLGTIGFRCNLLSAVCAGLSILFLGRLANTLWPNRKGEPVLVCVVGMLMCWALTEQAVRTEVYTLTLFFILLSYWSISPHFSTLSLLDRGSLAITLNLSQQARARRPADSQAPRRKIGVYSMTRLPIRRPLIVSGLSLALAAAVHPLLAFTAGLALGFSALIPVFKRGAFPSIGWGLGGLFLGCFVWLYLPLSAHRTTPVHLGDPSSFDGFLFMITGKAYSQNIGAPADGLWIRLYGLLKVISHVSGPFLFFAAGASLLLCWSKKLGGRLSIILPAALLVSGLIPPLLMGSFLPFNPDLRGYLLPAICALFLLATWTIVSFPQKIFGKSRMKTATQAVLASALIVPFGLTHAGKLTEESRRGPEAHDLTVRVSGAVKPGTSLIVAENDHFLFSLLYTKAAEDWRPDVALAGSWLIGSTAHWYRRLIKDSWPWLFVPVLDDGGKTQHIRHRFISMNAPRLPVYLEIPLDLKNPFDLEDCGVVYGVLTNKKDDNITERKDLSLKTPLKWQETIAQNKICNAFEEFPHILEPESGRMIHCYISMVRSRFLASRKKYDKALQQLKPHLANPPPARWKNAEPFLCTTSEPFVMSAQIHIQKKQYMQAEIHLNHALKNEPHRVENLIEMGRLMALQKKQKKAAQWFSKALALDEENVRALFYLAMIKGRSGSVREANALLKRAREKNPKLLGRLFNMHRGTPVSKKPSSKVNQKK